MVSSQVKEPLVFNNGQYLQVNSLFHGLLSISLEGLSSLDFVLVEAHTKLLKDSKHNFRLLSRARCFSFPRIPQLMVIVSLKGGFSGLWVVTQYNFLKKIHPFKKVGAGGGGGGVKCFTLS